MSIKLGLECNVVFQYLTVWTLWTVWRGEVRGGERQEATKTRTFVVIEFNEVDRADISPPQSVEQPGPRTLSPRLPGWLAWRR